MKIERLNYCLIAGVLSIIVAGGVSAELPEVAEAAIQELGITYGEPQINGFVFIEGRFIPSPYTVTRKGNALFINRIQIEQPVAWSALSGEAEEPKKALDANGDFEVVAPAAAPAEPAAVPAEPAAVPAEPAAPAAAPAAPKQVKSIDDLFADDAPAAAPAAAAAEPVAAGAAADAAPAAPAAAAAAAAAAAPAAATTPSVRRTPEELKKLKEDLKSSLDARRKSFEQALSRGEIYFFSQRHSRLNGNYGTARTLMGVLPSALRYAQSPQDLLQRLNQGNVYFVDFAICSALYKNKLTFPLLEERLKRIEEQEALDAARRTVPLSR